MNAYYVTQVLKQGINIKTTCRNYILELRNPKSHLLQVYLGAWVKIENVIENPICYEMSLLLFSPKHNYCFAVGLTSNLFVCSEVNMTTWQYSWT